MERHDLTSSIFTISDVLTADECRQMIALAEERGFDAAPNDIFDVQWLDDKTRNNDGVIVVDFDLERRVWSRVEKFVPRMLAGWPVRGLNEFFRFYRYRPGQRFSWHRDGSFAGRNGEVSVLTFMIYLSEDYEGGETRFESSSVVGKRGMALVFEHGILHEGAEVTGGVKYVLRSDVMCGRWAHRTAIDTLTDLTSRWRHYEEFYRELKHEGMAAFVERVAPLAIAENILPFNSHAWLALSKYGMRSIHLLCNRQGTSFGIRWYKKKGESLVRMQTVEHIDSARWQRMVAWLNLQGETDV